MPGITSDLAQKIRRPPAEGLRGVSGRFPPGQHCWATRYLVQLFDQNKSSLNKSNFLPDSNQIQSFLIVNEFNMMPIDCFQIVFFLFQFENVLDEKLLKIFVGKIDAKLLKRIGVEIFKTKNIQNANTCSINVFDSRVLFVNGCVDLFHNVDE